MSHALVLSLASTNKVTYPSPARSIGQVSLLRSRRSPPVRGPDGARRDLKTPPRLVGNGSPGRLPLPSSAGAGRALLGLGEELANRIVGLARRLDLRHVSAVELDMTSPRQRLGHMPREGDRDEPGASTPDEQRVGLQTAQSRPEAALPGGLLQVDLARGGVEGRPTG